MAVSAVNQMWSRFGVAATRDSIKVTEAFQVVHGVNDLPPTIYAGVDPTTGVAVPYINQIHGVYDSTGVTSLSLEKVSPILSIIIADFEGRFENADPTPNVKITWSSTSTSEPIDQDFDGAPIVTANGEPIEGITMDLHDQVATIERRFFSINLYAINEYLHSVNSDNFLGFPPGMVKLTNYKASFSGGMWDVSAVLQVRFPYNTTPARAWYARARHEGYMINVGGTYRRAIDTDVAPTGFNGTGEPMTRPVLLKADGRVERDPANAVWLHKKLYQPLPYNSLGLL